MRLLIEHPLFSSVRDFIEHSATEITRSPRPVLIVSKPSLNGSLSVAPIEAALLDEGIPYRRRFSISAPNTDTFIRIIDDHDSNPQTNSPSSQVSISATTVEGLRGRLGDSRKGLLSTVAQSHALAQAISQNSSRLRRIRPWILSGNWISDALDTTYDPVFTALRDFLSTEGSIRIVPVTEVESPYITNYKWLESVDLEAASNNWQSFDPGRREKSMDSLARSALTRNQPSTARLEELLWHCILGPDWRSDLASQITRASEFWDNMPPIDAASELADLLLSKGTI